MRSWPASLPERTRGDHCGRRQSARRALWTSHHSVRAPRVSSLPSHGDLRAGRRRAGRRAAGRELSAVEALRRRPGARRRDRATLNPFALRLDERACAAAAARRRAARPRRRAARSAACRLPSRTRITWRACRRRTAPRAVAPLHARRDRQRRAPARGRRRGDLRQDHHAGVLLRRHDARHPQPARPVEDARRLLGRRRGGRRRRAPARWPSAATAAARSASRPRSAASSASSPPSARSRASRAPRAGRRSSPTARWPAPSPTPA